MSCGSRSTGICLPLIIILPLSLAKYLINFCSLLVKLANDDREGFGNAFCSQYRLLNTRLLPSGRTTFTALSDHVTTEPFGISSPLARRCSCAKVTVVPFEPNPVETLRRVVRLYRKGFKGQNQHRRLGRGTPLLPCTRPPHLNQRKMWGGVYFCTEWVEEKKRRKSLWGVGLSKAGAGKNLHQLLLGNDKKCAIFCTELSAD